MYSTSHPAFLLRHLCALALGALALVTTVSANTSNWKLHTGTTTFNGMTWGEIQRSGDADPRTDTTMLDTWTWIWGQKEGLGSGRDQLAVNAFMNGIEADYGVEFRTEMRQKAKALIAAMKAKNNGHKVYWQIGNEINSRHFGHGNENTLGAEDKDGDGVLEEGNPETGQEDELDNMGTLRDWAVYHGRDYPHPLTPWDGADGTGDGRNDRGYIPYLVEYFLAPTIQAIMTANAAEPDPNFRIKIMAGSIANAGNPEAQNTWVPAFLEYEIQGTYCGAGSPLIGKTVKEAVDLLSIHYLMADQNQLALDGYYDTWVSPYAPDTTPTTITGIITTEEIGIATADAGLGAVRAMQVFSRYADVWLSRGFTHEQGALCFYGTNNGTPADITTCKADYAMKKLAEFLPSATSNFSAFADVVSTDSSQTLETIGFKNQDDSKRVYFLSSQTTNAHTLSLANIAGSGWTGSNASVSARVFTTTGETIPSATIVKNPGTGNYDITLSPAVSMGTSTKMVVLYVTAPTAPPSAPTGLTATAGNAQVALSWSASSGATSYKVKRSTTSGGPYTTIASPSTPSHTDTGVTNGTTYYYVVSAVNAGGESGNSSQASATPVAPAPTFLAAGAAVSGTGEITPALPSGVAIGDILLLFVETANQAASISAANGGTWAAVANSPQGTGAAGDTSATCLTVFWSRYVGTAQGAPIVADSGDHQIGRIIAIRGAASTGNPWNVTAGGTDPTADTGASIPGATTTVGNTLVVLAIAASAPTIDGSGVFSQWTNAALTSLTERTDNSRAAGNGGAIGVATGVKASAGAYGNTTATHSTSAVKGMISIAIKP